MAGKTYYHTTSLDNADNIVANGIAPRQSYKATNEKNNLQDLTGIYVFDNIDDAHSFGRDQNQDYAIFSVSLEYFEAGEDYNLLIDPEFETGSYMIHTDEWIEDVELIETYEL